MRIASFAFASLVSVVAAASLSTGCDNDGPIIYTPTTTETEPEQSPGYDYSDASVSAGEKVEPGGAVSVTITITNAGDAAWVAGDMRLIWSGDAAWGDADLPLAADVEPGAAATFETTLTAPQQVGRHTLAWQPAHGTAVFGARLQTTTLVTCDDGVFCNGAERFTDGKCNAGAAPCDDGAACTTDACDEASGLCSHELGANCSVCLADCTPDCTGKECGDDGCGGTCGDCGAGLACAAALGACKQANQEGTCAAPLPLLQGGEPLEGLHTIAGDTTSALHEVVPTCNSTSTAVEHVFTFTLDGDYGIDARSYGYDTVLHIRKEDPGTPETECLDDSPAATVGCSDDAAPPGDYGSRVAVALDAGTYYLIVDGFDSTQFGPFQLDVKLVPGTCVPSCDGQYCGDDDGCGGDCGKCGDGFACEEGQCKPDPCVPDCEGKACGGDGCGGTCGACGAGELCVPADSQCKAFPKCDHDLPSCEPACGAGQFCGTDCACHGADDPMPDLVVNAARLKDEVLFDEIMVDPASCAVVEKCVGGTGMRKLLRFSVEAVNQGQATLTVPPPPERPDLFEFSVCHGHYHFGGFASYALLDKEGTAVLTGRKQAYCMEDTAQFHQGPEVACSKQYDCDNQGIQAGWSDLYGNTLDCQWLDITDIEPGDYQIQVALNPNRAFEEISFDNNVATVDVTIP